MAFWSFATIGSGNCLSAAGHQAIILTSADLSVESNRTNFIEIE